MAREIRNIGASARARLLTLSRANGQSFDLELTRFALLYLAAFGAGLSLRTGDLVNVDLVCEALPGRWPRVLRAVSAGLTALLCAALLWPAWRYAAIGAMQTSPALGWRMDWVHASMLVLLVTLLVAAVLRVADVLQGREGPGAGSTVPTAGAR